MEIKKKQYAKPQLRTIELKAEEVLVAGCKTLTKSAPGGAPCMIRHCAGKGS